MKIKIIILVVVGLLMSGAWHLGRLTLKHEMALNVFMDQTVYLGYIQKNDINSATNLIRVSNDALLLELTSKHPLSFQSDLGDKWLKTYGALRASLPDLPDVLFDPEQDKRVKAVLDELQTPGKGKQSMAD